LSRNGDCHPQRFGCRRITGHKNFFPVGAACVDETDSDVTLLRFSVTFLDIVTTGSGCKARSVFRVPGLGY